MACVESLQGNLDEALTFLEKSIQEGGYDNVIHMKADPDLKNIRELPRYQLLLSRFSSEQQPKEQVPEQPEEEDEEEEEEEEQQQQQQIVSENIQESLKQPPPQVPQQKQENEEEKLVMIEPEPEPENKPAVEFFYAPQLKYLTDMGFDRETCTYFLNYHQGNIEIVLNEIL
jgi:cobalamin biosynthesis protein CobT